MAAAWFRVYPPEDKIQRNFNGRPGIRHAPPVDSNPLTYFRLFFTLNIMREIVRQTNRYARQRVAATRNTLGAFSRVRQWIRAGPLTISELQGFIAVIINMGLIRKPTIAEYWNDSKDSQRFSWFRQMFSRNRFQLILKFLHIVDNRRVPGRHSQFYRPDGKFKPFLEFANRMFKRHYRPRQNVCVDETLVATRGRTSILQFIPSKSAKFGVNFWCLAESLTGYIMHMSCYMGKVFEPTTPGTLQGTTVVLKLLKACKLLFKGYHVVCDSFFCSLNLAKCLLDKLTYVTGTVRVNRPMPKVIKEAAVRAREAVYMRKGSFLMTAYKSGEQRKPVRLLTTYMHAGEENGLPAVVKCYNMSMGGVDENDKMMSFYSNNRKTLKVWKKMMFHILHRMLLNAFIIYTQNSSDRPLKSRMNFIQDVVDGLAHLHIRENRKHRFPWQIRRIRNGPKVVLVKMPGNKYKDCVVCSDRHLGLRRRSRTVCQHCQRGLHKTCSRRHICIES